VAPSAAQATTNRFCVQVLESGASSCFQTEHELAGYQDSIAAVTLVTLFRDVDYVGAGGYRNYASAYGREWCQSRDVHEASSGDFRLDRFSTGEVMDRRVTSFVIRDAGSFCRVRFWGDAQFTGQSLTSFNQQDCPNMNRCFGVYQASDWARSFALIGP
jgi:hypothetical protein